MDRYRNTEKRRKDNKLVYRSTLYQSIPVSDDDIYVITQYGDRLDLIAHQFYGDVTLWWYVARANNLFTLNVPPNIQLRIPSSTQYAQGT